MSLYDGLEDGKGKSESKSDISGWGSMHKMLEIQKQLQAKSKASQLQPKVKKGTTLAPVINLRRQDRDKDRDRERDRDRDRGGTSELYFNQQTGRLEKVGGGVPTGGTPFIASEAPSVSLLGVTDEYDPLRPNDYEDFVKKRREQRKKEDEEKRREKDKERDERRRRDRDREDSDEEDYERRRRRRDRDDEDEERERERRDRDRERDRGRGTGAAIAPPPSLISEDRFSPTPEEQSEIDAQNPFDSPPRPMMGFGMGPKTGSSFGMAGSVAAKIMEKLGYKEGSGLGKNQQGMSMALQVEKTSKRGGKIIHEKDILKMESDKPKLEANTNANLMRNPSKVILLRNMVGPGEVDEELEPETAEECSKYGKVIKCVIFEIPDENDPEEAVRIFIEFERMESAIKALIDLNGRYFGGRMVKATFYNLDKFRRLDLVDIPFP